MLPTIQTIRATQLITSDEQLRKYIPNLFATAKGETPFYDKLLPWLDTAERWVVQQFIGNDFLPALLATDVDEPMRVTATLVVVNEAFMRAVPSLDLVLTPNGFGIVSNQNVAPASRDRVARLLASLESNRDNSIEQLVRYLHANNEWADGSARRWFAATLFPNIDLANLCGFTEHRWVNYLGLRSKAIDLEHRIAEEFISPEQLDVFRREVMTLFDDMTLTVMQHARVTEQLRQIIVNVLQGNLLNIQSLRDIVDFMRKHETHFPEFAASDTAKLFTPPIFENKKENHGYFF